MKGTANMLVKRKKMLIWFLIAALLFVMLCIAALDYRISAPIYAEHSEKITSGVRIALISDHHSSSYGSDQQELMQAIRAQQPDLILLTGDIFDDAPPHDNALTLLQQIGKEYPCFYVAGNHEFWSGEINVLKDKIRACGITVLEGSGKRLFIKGQELYICGVDDPECSKHTAEGIADWDTQLERCCMGIPKDIYSILLSHRPELTDRYQNSGFDLVLAGHAHGGQVRIPGILNGLFSPGEGFFPKYAGGRYELNGNVTLIVSRGLAKSALPRVFNPPELVIVDLLPRE